MGRVKKSQRGKRELEVGGDATKKKESEGGFFRGRGAGLFFDRCAPSALAFLLSFCFRLL